MLEEQLKKEIGEKWFSHFDTKPVEGKIDFSVFPKQKTIYNTPLLWAEAKSGSFDNVKMFTQLILTIGRHRYFDYISPPAFLGAFDFFKISFLPYVYIEDIFLINDFNWNVPASDHKTKEFKLVYSRILEIINQKAYIFNFLSDAENLKKFISNNVGKSDVTSTIKINKNNFIPIYIKWLKIIKPLISINWTNIKEKYNLIDSDFFLADIFLDDKGTFNIKDDVTLQNNLTVIFSNSSYKILKKNLPLSEMDASIQIGNIKTYTSFWRTYKRPPAKKYQSFILDRRDLLVPQDVRERKGAYFTPYKWVELSQTYISNFLGDDWQEEFYVWDCSAGTGNLLAGLNNKINIFASTLDKSDINVIHERIEKGANLLKKHVFQFDFLNDDFSKLPKSLFNIINDPQKRKKLIIYINPPYAEASDKKTLLGRDGKSGVEQTMINKKYSHLLGQGNAELYAQFLIRINKEISGCFLANFSTLKILQGRHFSDFRSNFKGKLKKLFLVPANTFDNVKGKFPIGFMIWDTKIETSFKKINADVYGKNGDFLFKKNIIAHENEDFINEWIKPHRGKKSDEIILGKFPFKGNDFQNQNMIAIVHNNMIFQKAAGQFLINPKNLIITSVYFSVRKVIPARWDNDRDQFLKPKESWINDLEFHGDCLAYTLFNNNIRSEFGVNHWIPFNEKDVNSREKFESNFMKYFIDTNKNLIFSKEAKSLFISGLKLWKFYHSIFEPITNASLYDIRLHFQGKNEKGKMNKNSTNSDYSNLISNLRSDIKILSKKIEIKVYEYEFLKD